MTTFPPAWKLCMLTIYIILTVKLNIYILYIVFSVMVIINFNATNLMSYIIYYKQEVCI